MNKDRDYLIGLDIGTNSVGWAAVYQDDYSPVKYKGEIMLGSHVFEEGKLKQERRLARTSRRRLKRVHNRLRLLQELFASEIASVDPDFYKRIETSRLFRDDAGYKYPLFNDPEYTDKDYYKQYPTIHHLIMDLMKRDEMFDIRLVYLACAWLIKHRGHFLSEISKNNIEETKDFTKVYENFKGCFSDEIGLPWDSDKKDAVENILRSKDGISTKKNAFKSLVYDGKYPKEDPMDEDSYPYNREQISILLSGGKGDISKLFIKQDYSEVESKGISLESDDEELEKLYLILGDDAQLIMGLKSLYDWGELTNLLGESTYISESKVKIYEQHKEDLKALKYLIKKYEPDQYKGFFVDYGKTNYVTYVKNIRSIKNDPNVIKEEKISKPKYDDFRKTLSKILEKIKAKGKDIELLEDIKKRLDDKTLLPKQVEGVNRLIPYQLYWAELRLILNNQSKYYSFLNDSDEYGTTVEKILSIMEYKIPYFVGPLNPHSEFAWVVRKQEGRILPWNIEDMVDYSQSEQAFIDKMTNTCTYLPSEKVLPKYSILYSRFMMLNQINNLKIDSIKISSELKQKIYTDICLPRATVTKKAIFSYLLSNNILSKGDEERLTGVDVTLTSSLKSVKTFTPLIEIGKLTEKDSEDIISMMAVSQDKSRLKKWMEDRYPSLDKEDITFIASQKFVDFGRLSRRLLTQVMGTRYDDPTGEVKSIIEWMWDMNVNLSEIISSDDWTFKKTIQDLNDEYYENNKKDLNARLDDMWASNQTKRIVFRTLDVINDIVKANGKSPKKIIIESAREAGDSKKGQRTSSRKAQLLELYKNIKNEDISELRNSLELTDDERLQSINLYLYYTQLGRSMYTGKPIDISSLLIGQTFNRDHIYPQSFTKDDSILNNLVLVEGELNHDKSDTYPIDPEIQKKMTPFWKHLKDLGLITDEKYKRLTRKTPFTTDEKLGFLNRQLVETRQSTKIIKNILLERFNGEVEIVFSKAAIADNFKSKFDFVKSRELNDLHHAKDAYINCVVGNVYDEVFNKRWFNIDNKYSMKVTTLCGDKDTYANGKIVWNGSKSHEIVRKTMENNHIHYTKFQTETRGTLYNLNPLRPSDTGRFPLKNDLSVERYGGYKSTTGSFFTLVKYRYKEKTDIAILPVELIFANNFKSDSSFREKYIADKIKSILNRDAEDIYCPLGERILKINTIISVDGYKCAITGRTGARLLVSNMEALSLPANLAKYYKNIENVLKKYSTNKNYIINEEYDNVSLSDNISLYEELVKKANVSVFRNKPGNIAETLVNGSVIFKELSTIKQCIVLQNIVSIFHNNNNGADLTLLGGGSRLGVSTLSMSLSNWDYTDIRIIDSSSTGLFVESCENLKDLF